MWSRRAVALVALVALVACGGPSSAERTATRREEQVVSLARKAGLSTDVARLLGNAAGAAGERYVVVYDLGDAGTATVSQDPPQRRVDVRVRDAGGEVTRSLLAGDDGSFSCERRRGRWTCARATTPAEDVVPFGPTQLDEVLDAFRASKDDYTFRVGHRDVAGIPADCLVTELRPGHEASGGLGGKGTLCVSAEGVPLLVETPTTSLRALRYTSAVPDDAFRLPAKVQS